MTTPGGAADRPGPSGIQSAPAGSSTRFRDLTLAMVLLIVLNPFLSAAPLGRLASTALMSVIFYFGVVAVSDSKKHRVMALGLGVPWFVLAWGGVAQGAPGGPLDVAASGFAIGFFAFTVAMILTFLLKARRVTPDVLWGAVAIYLMLGGLWFALFSLLEHLQPGSFYLGVTGAPAGRTDLVYFSFVTLTTLGFGDVVPVTAGARNLAVLEAIAGVMYLPIVLSRLVALFIDQAKEEPALQAESGGPHTDRPR